MFAFYKDQDRLYKLYDYQDDWQVTYKNGSNDKERWFSIWNHDKIGSAHHAMQSCIGTNYNPENLVVC